MPGELKKKSKSPKNRKANTNGDTLVNTCDDKNIEISNIVSVDKANIIIVNNEIEAKLKNVSLAMSGNEASNTEVKRSMQRNQSLIGTISEEPGSPKPDDSLRSVDLDEAFLYTKNNNSNSQSKNYYNNSNETKMDSKNKICFTTASEAGYHNEDYKTIDDTVGEGVPLPIAVIKHPLQDSWTFWYHGDNDNLTWKGNHLQIATVDTVEDFWQVFHHMNPASTIRANCDYSLFKKGILPDWEDFQNMPGGRWNVRGEAGQLDDWWMEILLLIIGEQPEQHAQLVNGAVVNIKNKADKLSIWLNDVKNTDGVMEIGRLLKSRLGLGTSTKITFTLHSEDRKTRKSVRGTGRREDLLENCRSEISVRNKWRVQWLLIRNLIRSLFDPNRPSN